MQGSIIAGRNTYCGPFAVGYCAKVSPDTVAQYIRKTTGIQRVRHMTVGHIFRALREFGCGIKFENEVLVDASTPVTLQRWFEQRPDKCGLYLVLVPNHYIIIDGETVYDNSKKQGVPFSEWKHPALEVQVSMEIQPC